MTEDEEFIVLPFTPKLAFTLHHKVNSRKYISEGNLLYILVNDAAKVKELNKFALRAEKAIDNQFIVSASCEELLVMQEENITYISRAIEDARTNF